MRAGLWVDFQSCFAFFRLFNALCGEKGAQFAMQFHGIESSEFLMSATKNTTFSLLFSSFCFAFVSSGTERTPSEARSERCEATLSNENGPPPPLVFYQNLGEFVPIPDFSAPLNRSFRSARDFSKGTTLDTLTLF